MRDTTYYKPCPNCGANLDPGEKCDCENSSKIIHNELKNSVGGVNMGGTISLHDALLAEIDRVQELAGIYSTLPVGAPMAYSMRQDIKMAKEAINCGNVSLMCVVYQTLRKYS